MMNPIRSAKWRQVALIFLACAANADAADLPDTRQLRRVVDEAILPAMKEHNIPGMAVAVTVRGERFYFNYGVASKESGKKVTEASLFEVGSISKTFTATLASYAQARGFLALSDNAGKFMPALAGSPVEAIKLLDLGTYTASGLPLQFPETVTDPDTMIAYFRSWRPDYAAGTYRRYSNPSIGLLGYLTAQSMGQSFHRLMEDKIFPGLGMTSTYLNVPATRLDDYAYGYAKDGRPVRVNPGVLDAQAYGVKTTSADMVRFVEANMTGAGLDPHLQRAIDGTRTGYYQVGRMTQGLGWEMYAYPTPLDVLIAGNSTEISLKPNKVDKLASPRLPVPRILVNKTGSTNGFGAYVAFVPAENMGVILMANKNYPIQDRVKAAHRILRALDSKLD